MRSSLLIRGLFVALLFSLTIACSKEVHGPEAQTVEIDELPKEIWIPAGLWDEIEGKSSQVGHEAEKAEESAPVAGESETGSGVLFMPVDVILREKNAGALKNPLIRIHLPRGGGAIDLSRYVNDETGSFFVSFEWPEAEAGAPVQAWFVNRARRRRLGGELWGAGCNSWFRISSGLSRELKSGGLKVNTTRHRHVTVLGGHFVFATHKNGQVFVSQVTFKDPRLPDFYCEGI